MFETWFRSGLATILLLAMLGTRPVLAATVDAGTLSGAPFASTMMVRVGAFSQDYTFSVVEPGPTSLSLKDVPVESAGGPPLYNIGPITLALYGPPSPSPATLLGTTSTGTDALLSLVLDLLPGNVYTARASGTADGTFGGFFTFIAALTVVPEPSTFVLILAGLVAFGAVAGRRSR